MPEEFPASSVSPSSAVSAVGAPPAAPALESSSLRASSAPVTLSKRRRLFILASAVAFLAVLSTGILYWRSTKVHALTEKDSILLADFINTTGDPGFDGTLKQALAVQLQQSPFLSIVSDKRVRETLQYMGRSPEERVVGGVAREICERENIKAALNGSIAVLGTQYVVSLDAVNCQTGDSFAREQVTADSKEKVLPALGNAATHLRSKLGESLSSIRRFDKPVHEVTTTSLEALKDFARAQEMEGTGQEIQAIPLLRRTVERDPNFAAAYSELASIYANQSEEAQSIEYATKAYALRARVSDRERFSLDITYHWMVTGDLDKEMEVEQLFMQGYPREEEPVNNLAINDALYLGQFEKALQLGSEAIRMNPRSNGGYGAITFGYLAFNRPEEAKTILVAAQKANPDHRGINDALFVVYSALDDQAGVQRQLQWASGKVMAVGTLAGAAGKAARSGKMRQARELSNQAIELLLVNNFKDSASGLISFLALTEAEIGNSAAARKKIASSMALSHTRSNLPTLAVALALVGETTQSQSLINELRQRYPSDFQVSTVVGPVATALLQSAQGNAAAAIQTLSATSRAELGGAWGFLPIYVRGLVYLRNQQGKEAAAQFQRILQYRDLGVTNPHLPLSYLGFARASALSGDTAKARTAYQDFFAFWKDADPDIPILKQAKAEYATLH